MGETSFFTRLPLEILGIILQTLDNPELKLLLDTHPTLKQYVIHVFNSKEEQFPYFQIDGLTTLRRYPHHINAVPKLQGRKILLVLFDMSPWHWSEKQGLKMSVAYTAHKNVFKPFEHPVFDRLRKGVPTYICCDFFPDQALPPGYNATMAELKRRGMKIIERRTKKQYYPELKLFRFVPASDELPETTVYQTDTPQKMYANDYGIQIHWNNTLQIEEQYMRSMDSGVLKIDFPRGTKTTGPSITDTYLADHTKELHIEYHTDFPRFQNITFNPQYLITRVYNGRVYYEEEDASWEDNMPPHLRIVDLDTETCNGNQYPRTQIYPNLNKNDDLKFMMGFKFIDIVSPDCRSLLDGVYFRFVEWLSITETDAKGPPPTINAPMVRIFHYETRVADCEPPIFRHPGFNEVTLKSTAPGLKLDRFLESLSDPMIPLAKLSINARYTASHDPTLIKPEHLRTLESLYVIELRGVSCPWVTQEQDFIWLKHESYPPSRCHLLVKLDLVKALPKGYVMDAAAESYMSDTLHVKFLNKCVGGLPSLEIKQTKPHPDTVPWSRCEYAIAPDAEEPSYFHWAGFKQPLALSGENVSLEKTEGKSGSGYGYLKYDGLDKDTRIHRIEVLGDEFLDL